MNDSSLIAIMIFGMMLIVSISISGYIFNKIKENIK